MKKYGKIDELESVITTLGQKIYQSEQRLERSNQFWQHKDQTVRCLIALYGKGVPDAHILCLPNFFGKLYDKIDMQSLELDLEKYASMKKNISRTDN
jgi:hypothetical protein